MIPFTTRSARDVMFITGATGMLGDRALVRMLHANPTLRVLALVRSRESWRRLAARLGGAVERVRPVRGDLRCQGLALTSDDRERILGSATIVVHAAADIVFSRSLAESRNTNVGGTAQVLELADACRVLRRFVFVSTAFVAGRRTGTIPEDDLPGIRAWVNPYEQSKHEAESRVREARPGAAVIRPSTVVFDRETGDVPQYNAAHKALRLLHRGLVPMLPGTPDTFVDLVPADFVAEGIARIALSDSVGGGVYQLCAGEGALSLDALLETTWARFRDDAAWRRRGIPEPAIVGLDTYRLFTRSVEETADASLRRAARGLSHFVPQLALPKRFVTSRAEAVTGLRAPRVAEFWMDLLDHLIDLDWSFTARGAAA